ncbi:MAG: four helix bundle protein [Paludibacteraceae bacterium]|nr:four helix bundle protein [Paludibacteraceae bacterium]
MEFGYRKLVVYTKATDYVQYVYSLLKKFPEEEKYGLCSQLRRASVSITSNIAEGVSRYSSKDKIHFMEIAFGSLMETMSQLEIANKLYYITNEELTAAENKASEISKLLTNLQYSFLPKDKNGQISNKPINS